MPSPQDVVYLTNGRCNRYILVCDEAHAMQTLYSRRTKAALALCHSPLCRGVILSTGTPMKNGRPANLYPLLLGIQHPIAKNKLDFETRYCAAKKTPYCPWDISGAAHLDELRERIGEHLIRKTKVLCCRNLLSGRPQILNTFHKIGHPSTYYTLCIESDES